MNEPHSWCVKRIEMRFAPTFGRLCVVLIAVTFSARGQEAIELDVGELGQLVESAQEWAKENLDEDVLQKFPEVDRAQYFTVEQALVKMHPAELPLLERLLRLLPPAGPAGPAGPDPG